MTLTPEQETAAAAVEAEWLAAGLETGPADRPAVEAGVALAYKEAGLAPPAQVYWFGSPRAGAVAAALLSGAALTADEPEWVVAVEQQLRSQGWQPGDVTKSVRGAVRSAPWAAARAQTLGVIGAEAWAQLSAAAGRRAWQMVMDRIAGRLRQRLGADLREAPGEVGAAAARALLDAVYGQHDAAWLATFDAAERGGFAPAMLPGLGTVARGAGWWWPLRDAAIVTERPVQLARDNVGRLHRGDGAAMEFADGYGLWAWRGMPIPVSLVEQLPTLTAAQIGAETNAELRRVMLEHFGYDRFLRDSDARRQHQDETGTLWYLDLPMDEPLVMVQVVNSTPEPDGTSRVYWLRVPPQTRTAREGVAWTFGLTEEQYQPLVQT